MSTHMTNVGLHFHRRPCPLTRLESPCCPSPSALPPRPLLCTALLSVPSSLRTLSLPRFDPRTHAPSALRRPSRVCLVLAAPAAAAVAAVGRSAEGRGGGHRFAGNRERGQWCACV
jgi:hypothetical protein